MTFRGLNSVFFVADQYNFVEMSIKAGEDLMKQPSTGDALCVYTTNSLKIVTNFFHDFNHVLVRRYIIMDGLSFWLLRLGDPSLQASIITFC